MEHNRGTRRAVQRGCFQRLQRSLRIYAKGSSARRENGSSSGVVQRLQQSKSSLELINQSEQLQKRPSLVRGLKRCSTQAIPIACGIPVHPVVGDDRNKCHKAGQSKPQPIGAKFTNTRFKIIGLLTRRLRHLKHVWIDTQNACRSNAAIEIRLQQTNILRGDITATQFKCRFWFVKT